MALTLALFAAAPARGQLTVDDFTTGQGPVTQTAVIGSQTSTQTGAGIVGGERTIRVTLAAVGGTVTATVAANALSFTTDVDADLEMWWDGNTGSPFDPTGLGGIDLTAAATKDRFILTYSGNTNTTATLGLQVHTNGSDRSEATFTLPAAAGTVDLLFTSFANTGGAGADFTDVGLIFLRTIDRVGAWSFTFSFLETVPVELLSLGVD